MFRTRNYLHIKRLEEPSTKDFRRFLDHAVELPAPHPCSFFICPGFFLIFPQKKSCSPHKSNKSSPCLVPPKSCKSINEGCNLLHIFISSHFALFATLHFHIKFLTKQTHLLRSIYLRQFHDILDYRLFTFIESSSYFIM